MVKKCLKQSTARLPPQEGKKTCHNTSTLITPMWYLQSWKGKSRASTICVQRLSVASWPHGRVQFIQKMEQIPQQPCRVMLSLAELTNTRLFLRPVGTPPPLLLPQLFFCLSFCFQSHDFGTRALGRYDTLVVVVFSETKSQGLQEPDNQILGGHAAVSTEGNHSAIHTSFRINAAQVFFSLIFPID